MWRDAYRPRNLDVPGATAEFGPVTMKTVLMGVLGRDNRLISDGPKRVARKIPNVAKLPPAISCGILAPPSNVKILPGRPTGTRRSEQDAIATVRENGGSGGCIGHVSLGHAPLTALL